MILTIMPSRTLIHFENTLDWMVNTLWICGSSHFVDD